MLHLFWCATLGLIGQAPASTPPASPEAFLKWSMARYRALIGAGLAALSLLAFSAGALVGGLALLQAP